MLELIGSTCWAEGEEEEEAGLVTEGPAHYECQALLGGETVVVYSSWAPYTATGALMCGHGS